MIAAPHADISPAIKARDSKGASSDGDGDGAILVPMVAHSLRGEGFDASEDGTGRGTPLVPVAATLEATAGRSRGAGTPVGMLQPVAFDTTQMTSAANYSNPQPGDPCHPLAAGMHAPAIAFSAQDNGRDAQELITPTMRKGGDGGDGGGVQLAVAMAMQVRRLTPMECERLQGFKDQYTNVAHRGKHAADGPRYKALGNSWAVPCARWIGERIEAVEQIAQERKAA